MKKIKALLLAVAMTAMLVTPAFAYTFESETAADIAGASSWAKEEVDAAADAGLLTENTSMNLRTDITRAQFAELAVNFAEKIIGLPITPAPADTFSDCTDEAVLKAYSAGIVDGVGGGKFAPDQTTNREQIATMINRALKYVEPAIGRQLLPAAGDLSTFTDNAKVSSWAKDGMGVLAANGIMKGASGKIMPKDSCTIEQSILMIYRVYQKY